MLTTFFTTPTRSSRLTTFTAEIVKGLKSKLAYPADSDFWMKENSYKNINATQEAALASIDEAIERHKKNLKRRLENYRMRAYL